MSPFIRPSLKTLTFHTSVTGNCNISMTTEQIPSAHDNHEKLKALEKKSMWILNLIPVLWALRGCTTT